MIEFVRALVNDEREIPAWLVMVALLAMFAAGLLIGFWLTPGP